MLDGVNYVWLYLFYASCFLTGFAIALTLMVAEFIPLLLIMLALTYVSWEKFQNGS